MSSTPNPPEWYLPEYPPLKSHDLVGRASVEGQLVTYPKIVRTLADPPINNQTIGNVSFMLFDEPKKTKNGKNMYGFFKLRGVWNGEQQAKFEASKIIREIDSKYPIKLSPVGVWLPITEDEDASKDKIDVKIKENEIHLRDEAAKEKEAENKKIQRELEEREKELKSGDIYDDPASLKYYSMRMITSLRLREERSRLLKQLSSIDTNITKVNKELLGLERTNPQYKDEWVECYNIERRKSGIPDFCPDEEFIKYHEESLKNLDCGGDIIEEGEKEE